ncbi:TPA: BREX-1 system adenine-specific DNA-methyltransferase PglX [Escherichia coli]|uniref:BREX-1 system adenine-specific DNA-methyltransferase PglX n=1 Tax=Escherichia coli TaxID=562 RepID=UPI00057963A1|nr:BREX-1 system adenine-specific DNA-methyltransferase PglX [Escherichia coli]EGL7073926.1 BREX-1 system adenine-specific DNA-methyltransferase PglX [Escherichia coli]MDC7004158.1 BREX-1 system adenine-specific DNA-methyltransferase PglX [Escherichia coli]MDC7027158.1 BREX-1 system adenine-specific DNA-methyltransferase PglX [Escherichia coli]MDD8273213.1 BREX-1 system adenine-specific DNA-methyltransferase PglX [Escherichia coli]HDW3645093.1 BREX-1 system adenine-specific DNA-methyltransfera
MNTNNIKKYAPQARNDFRDAVIQKLTTLGIAADKKGNLQIAEAETIGETVRYGQFDYPLSTLPRRERLVKRAREQGFEVLVEHCAYTWFNRLCAIRYMELHGYLDHGFRMLSHPETPAAFEVLDYVPEVAEALLPESKAQLVEMKLSGNQDEALYRELLLGQCHALHHAMPFLFEAVDDEAELLLPDNLTRTDSILRGLVDDIPEEDWEQVEVIGWLYQFYISEKKDAVIGKVVKSEDIPAATQLFTPNWIVQYLVQNSVGRQWLQTYPDSPLKDKMEYYIEPAEQTPEVQAQLAAITPASIEPESIKVLDPACGSGHILIEAYNVLKNIYEERGYRGRDIPQLILENNIFGLDIDDRAAQLSGFALLMMARQDDRRIFTRDVRLNIVSLQESLHLDIAKLWQQLNFHQQVQTGSMGDMFAENTALTQTDSAEYQLLMRMLKRFVNAKTLGSLIQVPQEEEAELKVFLDALYRLEQEGDFQQKAAAKAFIPFIQQAWILAQRYDAVVANPPYMGNGGMNSDLKKFAKTYFPDSKSDLFAMFMQHAFSLLKENGFNAQINMQSWMFLSSYENLRYWLLNNKAFITMAHLGARAFGQISGEVVQTTAWVIKNSYIVNNQPVFFRLIEGSEEQKKNELASRDKRFDHTLQDNFMKIPGSPIAYWLSSPARYIFETSPAITSVATSAVGLQTGDNDRFLKYWFEVQNDKIYLNAIDRKSALSSQKKWFPCNKGGTFRKWYGNQEYVVNWEYDGIEIKNCVDENGKLRSRQQNSTFYFRESVSWSDVTSGDNAFRYIPKGFIFDATGHSSFYNNDSDLHLCLAFLNNIYCSYITKILNPTIHFHVGYFNRLPFPEEIKKHSGEIISLAKEAVSLSANDWNGFERSWEFKKNPLVAEKRSSLRDSFIVYKNNCHNNFNRLYEIEFKNNTLFLDLYKLQDEFNACPDASTISLDVNPLYRYGSSLKPEQYQARFCSDSIVELLSYNIGCQMGRYSLDREGLIYAHEGNKGFADLVAEGAYKTFPADSDGILPLMDDEWFEDDVTSRVKEFVRTVWGEEHLQENLEFIAESLCLYAIKPKKGESALETIRRYLSTQFWKDHMKMYKKRPIYWLFSSGKEKAFECLVYLHRYNDATLSRMRTEYVVPLLARYQANIDRLNDQLDEASGGEATRLKRERDSLIKKFSELRSYDDRLRHYADMRISIDLDDGVKVNYGKFGDLLADVKAITGNAPEVI